jgi:DNA-binding transcriptional LysR family regulator
MRLLFTPNVLAETTRTFQKDASEVAVTVKGRVRVSTAEGVREGLGMTISSEWMFTPEPASGAIETALDDWRFPEMDLWAVFPAGRLTSAKARAFVAFIEAGLRC